MRAAALAAAALLAGTFSLVLVGATAAPLSRACASGLSEVACERALGAVVRRGLPAVHPLILAARVEPGSEPGPDQLGHRATILFDLLPPVGAVRVELHADQGGHWGGVIDRDPLEVAAGALAPLLGAVLTSAALVGLARRRSARQGTGP